MVLTVVPERFFGVWPGETCGARRSVSEMEDTYLEAHPARQTTRCLSSTTNSEAHIVLPL